MKLLRFAARMATRALRPSSEGYILSDYLVWLKARRGDVTFQYCRDAAYGFRFSAFVGRLEEPFLLLDVGANIGLYSLLALQNPHCMHVIAFEPDPESFAYLGANLRACGRTDWTTIPAAIGGADGLMPLFVPEGHSGGASLRGPADGAGTDRSTGRLVEVQVVGPIAISDLASRHPTPDIVLKVDVEGWEAFVLGALVEGLDRRVIAAWVEFSPQTEGQEAEAHLRDMGLVEVERVGTDSHYDALWCRPFSAIASGDRTPRRR